MVRIVRGIRGAARVTFYAAVVPACIFVALLSISVWAVGRLVWLRQSPTLGRWPQPITVVAPFPPGDESGGAKAVQGLIRTLERRSALLVVIVRKRDNRRSLRNLVASWLLRPVPVPNECRALLFGDAEVGASIQQTSSVVFEFMATGIFMLFGRPKAHRTILRDHEVLVRKLWLDLQELKGTDRFTTALRLIATYAVSAAVYLRADAIITLTEQDRGAIRKWFPYVRQRVVCIPCPFESRSQSTAMPIGMASRNLVMVANFFHSPNVVGLRWFLDECAPHLAPGYTLNVCGLDSPLNSLDLTRYHIRVVRHGFIENPDRIPEIARIAIAPLITGGGVRIKNLFLGSLGLALVTTPLGNEGIGFTHGRNALICSDPKAMADAIEWLASRPTEIARLGNEAQRHICRQFDPGRIEERLFTAISGAVS